MLILVVALCCCSQWALTVKRGQPSGKPSVVDRQRFTRQNGDCPDRGRTEYGRPSGSNQERMAQLRCRANLQESLSRHRGGFPLSLRGLKDAHSSVARTSSAAMSAGLARGTSNVSNRGICCTLPDTSKGRGVYACQGLCACNLRYPPARGPLGPKAMTLRQFRKQGLADHDK